MMEEYFCPNCNAVLNDQDGFDPNLGAWTCTECGETLYGDDVEEHMDQFDGVVWYCDECNAILNTQRGFDDSCGIWRCTKCGHENPISEDEIYESKAEYENRNKHRCPECGDLLEDQYSFYEYEETHTCTNCDTELFREDDEYKVAYRCPNCDELLNKQIGFYDYFYEWDCEECGAKLEKEYDGYHLVKDKIAEEDTDDDNDNDDDYDYGPPKGHTVYSGIDEHRRLLEAEEIIRKEKEREKKDKKRKFYKKHWRGLLILVAVLCLGCFGGYKYYQYQRSIPVGISSEALLGQNYEEAVSLLEKTGFTDVSSSPKYDIGVEDINIEGTIESVSIDGQTSFTEDKRFQYDAPVTVSYHKIKDINIPLSSKEAKKLQYEDLVNQLKDAGFIIITLEPEYDLIKGWLKKEGRVDSVTINGDSSFKANTAYRPDAEIIIVYHALKKDKKD